MRLFSRRHRTPAGADPDLSPRQAQEATLSHFQEFVRTHAGVEAFAEPATNSTPMTLVLIATSGEWTRRRVPSPQAANDLAQSLGIPVYDVQRIGYPQRMRDWNSKQRILAKRAREARETRR